MKLRKSDSCFFRKIVVLKIFADIRWKTSLEFFFRVIECLNFMLYRTSSWIFSWEFVKFSRIAIFCRIISNNTSKKHWAGCHFTLLNVFFRCCLQMFCKGILENFTKFSEKYSWCKVVFRNNSSVNHCNCKSNPILFQ